MEKSYRLHTNVGSDTLLHVDMKQDFEQLEILSLKLNRDTVNVYKKHASDYGVIVGRVLANDAFGIPNARVSVFIERDTDDDSEMRRLYPYETFTSKDGDGRRYNILPDYSHDKCYRVVGTFPAKRELLDNAIQLEVYDKYWKYTTVTNESGDYMLFGIPCGAQEVHVDLDLSDIGRLSQKPRDFTFKGYSITQFDNANQFKDSTNLDNLSQIFAQNQSVTVYPFWGDEDTGIVGITRCDLNIQYKFEPTCVFLGSIVSDNDSNAIGHDCSPSVNNGRNEQLVAGEGTIEMIRMTPDGLVEEYPIDGNRLIDSDGVWCYQIPMNLDYIGMDEYGNIVPTDNPSKGIPTRTRVRFRISKIDTGSEGFSRHTAKYLVPNNPELDESSNIPKIKDGSRFEDAYTFGSMTPKECFRDLYWNNVYSVKNYIPKVQMDGSIDSRNYTALKAANYAGDKNEIPFNKLFIRLPFSYIVLCILFNVLLALIETVNTIVKALMSIKDWSIDIIITTIRPFWWIPEIHCTSLSAGASEGNKAYYPGCGCPSSYACRVSPCPDDFPNGCTKSSDSDELKDQVERNLASEYGVVNLDLYEDWVNGSLYMPLWYWKKSNKRKFLFFTIESAKNDYCDCNRSVYSRIKSYISCQFKYTNNSFYHNYSDDNKWHKKNHSIMVRFKNGLVKNVKNADGADIYYYSSSNIRWVDNINFDDNPTSYKDGFYVVRLYATDIILLGNLDRDNIYGIPEIFSSLPPTTSNVPAFGTILGDDDNSAVTGMDWGNDGDSQTPLFSKGLFLDIDCTEARTFEKSCVNVERVSEYGVVLDMSYDMQYATGNSREQGRLETGRVLVDGFVNKYELEDNENRALFATMNHIGFYPNDTKDIVGRTYDTQVMDDLTGYMVPKFMYIYPTNFDGRLQHSMNVFKRGFDQQQYDSTDEAYITFRMGGESGGYSSNLSKRIRHFYDTNSLPCYNNSYYFYFGANKGNTAIEKFQKEYLVECFDKKRYPFTMSIETNGQPYCQDLYRYIPSGTNEVYIGNAIGTTIDYVGVSDGITFYYSKKYYKWHLYSYTSDNRIPTRFWLLTNSNRFVGADEEPIYISTNPNSFVWMQSMRENEYYFPDTYVGPETQNKYINGYEEHGTIYDEKAFGYIKITLEDIQPYYSYVIYDSFGLKAITDSMCSENEIVLGLNYDNNGNVTGGTIPDGSLDPEHPNRQVNERYRDGILNGTYRIVITDTNGKSVTETIQVSTEAIQTRYVAYGLGTRYFDMETTPPESICDSKSDYYGRIVITGVSIDGKEYGPEDISFDDTDIYTATTDGEYLVNVTVNNTFGEHDEYSAISKFNITLYLSDGSGNILSGGALCDCQIYSALTNTMSTLGGSPTGITHFRYYTNDDGSKYAVFYLYKPRNYMLKTMQLCYHNGEWSGTKNVTSAPVNISNGTAFKAFLNTMPALFMVGSLKLRSDGAAYDDVYVNKWFYDKNTVGSQNFTRGTNSGWFGVNNPDVYKFNPVSMSEENSNLWDELFRVGGDITTLNARRDVVIGEFNMMFNLSHGVFETYEFSYTSNGGVEPRLYRSFTIDYNGLAEGYQSMLFSDMSAVSNSSSYPSITYTAQGPVVNGELSEFSGYVGNYFAVFSNNGGFSDIGTEIDPNKYSESYPTLAQVFPNKQVGITLPLTPSNFIQNYKAVYSATTQGSGANLAYTSHPYLRTLSIDRSIQANMIYLGKVPGNVPTELTSDTMIRPRLSALTWNGIDMSYDEDYSIVDAEHIPYVITIGGEFDDNTVITRDILYKFYKEIDGLSWWGNIDTPNALPHFISTSGMNFTTQEVKPVSYSDDELNPENIEYWSGNTGFSSFYVTDVTEYKTLPNDKVEYSYLLYSMPIEYICGNCGRHACVTDLPISGWVCTCGYINYENSNIENYSSSDKTIPINYKCSVCNSSVTISDLSETGWTCNNCGTLNYIDDDFYEYGKIKPTYTWPSTDPDSTVQHKRSTSETSYIYPLIKRFYESKVDGVDVRNCYYSRYNHEKLDEQTPLPIVDHTSEATGIMRNFTNALMVKDKEVYNYPTIKLLDVRGLMNTPAFNYNAISCTYGIQAYNDETGAIKAYAAPSNDELTFVANHTTPAILLNNDGYTFDTKGLYQNRSYTDNYNHQISSSTVVIQGTEEIVSGQQRNFSGVCLVATSHDTEPTDVITFTIERPSFDGYNYEVKVPLCLGVVDGSNNAIYNIKTGVTFGNITQVISENSKKPHIIRIGSTTSGVSVANDGYLIEPGTDNTRMTNNSSYLTQLQFTCDMPEQQEYKYFSILSQKTLTSYVKSKTTCTTFEFSEIYEKNRYKVPEGSILSELTDESNFGVFILNPSTIHPFGSYNSKITVMPFMYVKDDADSSRNPVNTASYKQYVPLDASKYTSESLRMTVSVGTYVPGVYEALGEDITVSGNVTVTRHGKSTQHGTTEDYTEYSTYDFGSVAMTTFDFGSIGSYASSFHIYSYEYKFTYDNVTYIIKFAVTSQGSTQIENEFVDGFRFIDYWS